MSDIDDFAQGLASMNPAGAEAQPVQAADTTPQQPQEQPQEPAQPAPAEQPAPQPAEAPPLDERVSRELDGRLQATLAERDKRKEAERRAQAAEAEVQRYRAQQQPVQTPNVYDDPDGYQASVEARIAAAQQQATAAISQRFAAKEFGADKVEAAAQWFLDEVVSRDPTAQARFINDPDPFGMVVRQHHQHQLLAKMGDVTDLDQWIEQQAAARGFVKAGAAPAAPLQPTAPMPTRSLASAPSAGGPQTVPTGPLASLEAVFAGKP